MASYSSGGGSKDRILLALALWFVAPESWRVLPHPIYLAWMVSIVTFLLVAVIDRRPIKPVAVGQ